MNSITYCHCGANMNNSDHCSECGCEEFEGTCTHKHVSLEERVAQAILTCVNERQARDITATLADLDSDFRAKYIAMAHAALREILENGE